MPAYYRGVVPVIDHDHGNMPGLAGHSQAKPELPPVELPSLEEPPAEPEAESLPPAVVLPEMGPEIGAQVSNVLKDILSEYPDDVMLRPASDAPPRPQIVTEAPPAPPVYEEPVAEPEPAAPPAPGRVPSALGGEFH